MDCFFVLKLLYFFQITTFSIHGWWGRCDADSTSKNRLLFRTPNCCLRYFKPTWFLFNASLTMNMIWKMISVMTSFLGMLFFLLQTLDFPGIFSTLHVHSLSFSGGPGNPFWADLGCQLPRHQGIQPSGAAILSQMTCHFVSSAFRNVVNNGVLQHYHQRWDALFVFSAW